MAKYKISKLDNDFSLSCGGNVGRVTAMDLDGNVNGCNVLLPSDMSGADSLVSINGGFIKNSGTIVFPSSLEEFSVRGYAKPLSLDFSNSSDLVVSTLSDTDGVSVEVECPSSVYESDVIGTLSSELSSKGYSVKGLPFVWKDENNNVVVRPSSVVVDYRLESVEDTTFGDWVCFEDSTKSMTDMDEFEELTETTASGSVITEGPKTTSSDTATTMINGTYNIGDMNVSYNGYYWTATSKSYSMPNSGSVIIEYGIERDGGSSYSWSTIEDVSGWEGSVPTENPTSSTDTTMVTYHKGVTYNGSTNLTSPSITSSMDIVGVEESVSVLDYDSSVINWSLSSVTANSVNIDSMNKQNASVMIASVWYSELECWSDGFMSCYYDVDMVGKEDVWYCNGNLFDYEPTDMGEPPIKCTKKTCKVKYQYNVSDTIAMQTTEMLSNVDDVTTDDVDFNVEGKSVNASFETTAYKEVMYYAVEDGGSGVITDMYNEDIPTSIVIPADAIVNNYSCDNNGNVSVDYSVEVEGEPIITNYTFNRTKTTHTYTCYRNDE